MADEQQGGPEEREPENGGARTLPFEPAADEGDTQRTQPWDTSAGATMSGPAGGVAGQRFGDYELLAEIARGGMGVVYKARQVKLNRIVALKMILAGQFANAEEVRRFHAEAEAAAQLDHPGIVPVYEVGEHAGQPFFSMGFVDGPSLAKRLADGPLPPREAAELVRQVAEAVAYAHSRGIVHRDLKPGNILLQSAECGTGSSESERDRTGRKGPNAQIPRITDFGLAKRISDDTGLTATGQILGTPSYMAPEQARGQHDQVGPHSDVYALGAILYACLTGRPPFQGASIADTLRQVEEQEPASPRQLNASVPLDLDTIALKCLSKSPSGRYASALSLSADLGRYLRGEAVVARRIVWEQRALRWCKRKPAIATLLAVAAISLVGLISLGPVFWYRESSLREQARSALAQADDAKNVAADETTAAESRSYVAQIARIHAMLLAHDHNLAQTAIQGLPEGANEWEVGYLRRSCEGTPLTLRGHTGNVTRVAFSPDGVHLASAAEDGTAKLWAVDTGAEVRAYPVQGTPAPCIQFSPDGRRLATTSDEGVVTIWGMEENRVISCRGHKEAVASLCFSPDGERLASGSWDDDIRIWDAHSGETLLTLAGHGIAVTGVCFSPDGGKVASTSSDQSVRLWDARSGEQLLAFRGPESAVQGVCFSPDGSTLAGAAHDHAVWIWDTKTGEPIAKLSGHTATVTSVAFSPDGMRLASASWDGTVRVWDVRRAAELCVLYGHTGLVNCVAFSADGMRLASASDDMTVKVWGPREVDQGSVFRAHSGQVYAASFSHDGGQVATGSQDKSAIVWDARTGAPTHTLKGHTDFITDVCFTRDGTRLATASHDNSIILWDTRTGTHRATLKGHTGAVQSVTFSPDGMRLASGAWFDKSARIWDAETGQQVQELAGHDHGLNCVRYSADGMWLATASIDGTAMVWDLRSGGRTVLRGRGGSVESVAIHPDSSRAATGSEDGAIRIWDVARGTELLTLTGHSYTVSSIGFNPKGTRLASASYDGTVRVWDTASGDELLILFGHTQAVESVAFSDDGARVVSASHDRTARIWDTRDASRDDVDYSPWVEDKLRQQAMAAIWHKEDAALAKESDNILAERFHAKFLTGESGR